MGLERFLDVLHMIKGILDFANKFDLEVVRVVKMLTIQTIDNVAALTGDGTTN